MYDPIKRTLDVVFSLLAIAVLSPLLIVLAVAVKLSSPGPALFRQERVGKGKMHFMIYKYRTIIYDANYVPGTYKVSPSYTTEKIINILSGYDYSDGTMEED